MRREFGVIRLVCPGKRVVAIINTHVHADHHFGNEVFVREFHDAEIIAHEKFVEYLTTWARESGRDVSRDLPVRLMSRFPHLRKYLERVHVVLPTRLLRGDTTLEFGGVEIKVLHMPGHTDDQLVVYVPEERVLFASDTVYTSLDVPTLFMGDPDTWIESLRRMLALDFDVLLPGHGPIPSDPRAEINRHIRVLREVEREVIEALKSSGELSFKELEARVSLVRGRNLIGVLRALEKRGIVRIQTDGEEVRVSLLANAEVEG